MRSVLSLDFESYSKLPLGKSNGVGTSRYARHSSTEALMLAYALDDYATEIWVPAEGRPMPRDLDDMLSDPDIVMRAWNAPFEQAIFRHVLKRPIPVRRWRDTMVTALTCSLPGSLDAAGPILRLKAGDRKDTRGKALIRKFCMPRKPTKNNPSTRLLWSDAPEEWEEFKEYCKQDVDAERAVADTLAPWDLPDHEWDLWHLDQEINQRGLPVNMTVVRNALHTDAEVTAAGMGEMRRITGLDNPNSREQLLDWLRGQGYPYGDLKKGHVEKRLKALDDQVTGGDSHPEEIEAEFSVLQLRQETSKASIKKFAALDRSTDTDGRLRGSLQFAAAGRTWRWGGRIYQPQNLVRPPKWIEKELVPAVQALAKHRFAGLSVLYGQRKVMDVVSACVRPVIQAAPGCVFVDADLNAIENRVLGWMSGDKKILDVFKHKRDPYVDFATYMYGLPYEELYAEYKGGNSSKRTVAKPGVLGCGYMLSAGFVYEDPHSGEDMATGLLGYGWNMGVKLTPEQAKHSVDVWRSTFREAVDYWYEIEHAAKQTIRTKRPHDAGPVWFDISGPFMRMHLPSGRCLHYVRPMLENKMMPWKKMKEVITYEGLDDKNNWTRIQTHPGKLTENADQAISRDLIANGLLLADREGLDVCLHVHDQILAEVRESDAPRWLEVLKECMSTPPDWAKDLPLAAAGHISKYFLKD